MRSIVLIALLISYVLSASYSFSGNVTIANDAEFKYRSLLVLPEILGLNSYLSVSVDAQANNNGGTAALDVVTGGVLFNPLFRPTSFLGFTYVTATSFTDVITGKANATFDASSSFLLTSYLSIIERNAAGADVRTLNLKGIFWSSSKTQNGDLLTYSYQPTAFVNSLVLKSGESIAFDFITAAKLGTVDVGTQTVDVSPRTLESIVRINGWQYVTPTNSLVLRVGTVTGAANAAGNSNVQLIAAGSGNKQVYVQFADAAEINGAPGTVKISKTTSAVADLADYGTWVAQANAVYSGSLSGNVFEVTFTPNANSIVYDPTMGSGNMMQKSSASAILVTLLALVLALLA